MTVERNRSWGAASAFPDDGVVVASDAAARTMVEQARRAGVPPPALGLVGGDLCRTLGGRGDETRLRSGHASALPIDVGSALIDGRQYWFVAHLVIRRRFWRGRVVAVMNAEYLGRWDMAPRAHPNDGRLDVVDARLDPRAKLLALQRLPSGAHLPHPAIRYERVAALQLELDRAASIHLDGERVTEGRRVLIRVEPDAATVWV